MFDIRNKMLRLLVEDYVRWYPRLEDHPIQYASVKKCVDQFYFEHETDSERVKAVVDHMTWQLTFSTFEGLKQSIARIDDQLSDVKAELSKWKARLVSSSGQSEPFAALVSDWSDIFHLLREEFSPETDDERFVYEAWLLNQGVDFAARASSCVSQRVS